jgi:hypothetical protein
MGFHRRHITNSLIIEVYKSEGVSSVTRLFTSGADSLILESGLAAEVRDIIFDDEWVLMGFHYQNKEIEKRIKMYLDSDI